MLYEVGVYDDLTNDEYHAQQPVEHHYFSSSQFKTMLEDPEKFHKMYILGQAEKQTSEAMDIGTCYHTEILEPHLASEEYIVWVGGTRNSKVYHEFAEKHKGKIILTKKNKIELDQLVKVTRESPIAMRMVEESTSEESFFVELFGIRMKVRTDELFLSKEYSYIADLKSTTGNVKDKHKLRQKVAASNYDLSAAMYILVVNEIIRMYEWDVAPVTDFFWHFASKTPLGGCKTWRASEDQKKVGEAKFMAAVKELQFYMGNNWSFEDRIEDLEPQAWDKSEWIKESK